MQHKYPYIILLIIVLVSIYLVLFTNKSEIPVDKSQQASSTPVQEINDYTASFLIFINGTQQQFSSRSYYSLSPDVYIEQENPAIVHIKKGNISWNDFFSTLPMGISDTCLTISAQGTFCSQDNELITSNSGKLRFILNGNENPNALKTPINPGDKLLITFGNLTSQQLQSQYDRVPDPVTSRSAELELEE